MRKEWATYLVSLTIAALRISSGSQCCMIIVTSVYHILHFMHLNISLHWQSWHMIMDRRVIILLRRSAYVVHQSAEAIFVSQVAEWSIWLDIDLLWGKVWWWQLSVYKFSCFQFKEPQKVSLFLFSFESHWHPGAYKVLC